MDKREYNQLLENRMLKFTIEVIQLLKKHKQILPSSYIAQLMRSAASIGANYAEACNAGSKLDFRNKIFIAKKEAAESRYWIDLCSALTGSSDWSATRQEAHELLSILQAIIGTLAAKSKSLSSDNSL